MGSDPTGSFKTHANYLRSFAFLVDQNAWNGNLDVDALAERISASGILPAANPRDIDLEQVRRSIHNAWGTELLLSLGASIIRENELVALSNNWAVVQAYYVCYHSVQAYTVTKKFPRPDSHPKTQNQFFSLWVQRPLDISPWSLGAGEAKYSNFPAGVVIDNDLHPWTGCNDSTCWDLAAKALRTTREDSVADAFEHKREAKRRARRQEWFREQRERQEARKKPRRGNPPNTRPVLTPGEKAEVRRGVRAATIMDYLYRLRIKTNYVDANMFTDGPEYPADSVQVKNDVTVITAGTLLLHELAIGSQLGFDVFLPWARDWTTRNLPGGATNGLAGRLQTLERFG